MNPNVKALAEFLAAQLDGEPVPPHNSPALKSLSNAVAAVQRNPTQLESLGAAAVGLVIDRVRANIAAEQTLQAFITRGEQDD